MPVILLVGSDRTLQETRAAVLQTIGVEAVVADAPTAIAVQSERLFDLLLLCHTLPEDVAAVVAKTFRAREAFAPILHIVPLRTCYSIEDDGFETVTSAEPEQLLKRTSELLGIHRFKRAIA